MAFLVPSAPSRILWPHLVAAAAALGTLLLVALIALKPRALHLSQQTSLVAINPPEAARVGAGKGSSSSSWQSNLHVAATSYKPGLSWREMQKGVVSNGATARARRAAAKLLAGKPLTVAMIGGSVTWGQGASQKGVTDYAARVFAWINETFPGAKHTLVNGAIPAAPSSYFSLCNRWHVPPDADIIVVEACINDGLGSGDTPIRRAHERLLRKLLVYENRPAVLEMVFYRYPFPNWDIASHVNPYRYHGDDEIGVLAQYYHTAWVSIRSLVWDYLPETAQDPGDTKRTDKFQKVWRSIATDGDHPSDTGHGWMADMIIYWLQQMMDDVIRTPLGPEDDDEAQAELSAPMYGGNWESRNNTCLMGDMVKKLVTQADPAFQWINEGTEQKPKWGYVSTEPGSSLHVALVTDVAKGLGPGSKVSLAVGYLKSYEHMGMFKVACEEGCSCDPMKLDGHHSVKVSQLHHAVMLVTAAEVCHLKFTVLNETSSGDHKFKLIGLVVSEVAGWMISDNKDAGISVQYQRGSDGKGAEYGTETD